jgi:3-ketosteroid 9alpha-monooxygenase subunit B
METVGSKRLFHPLKVRRVIDETHDAKSVVFEIPPGLRDVFAYEAGQFLTLEIPYDGKTLRRCYSLASCPVTESEHKVTIKRVTDGRVSNWVNDELSEGETVSVLPPEGRFVLGTSTAPLMLFAGGSGITPVIALLKAALAPSGVPERRVKLVYANRDARSIIFARELDALARKHAGRLEIVHRQDDRDGFLRASEVPALLLARDAACYVCGPGPFMDAVESGLRDAGVPDEAIHIERFVSPPEPTPHVEPAADAALAVSAGGNTPDVLDVVFRGERRTVPYAPGKTLLRAAIDAGVDAPYSCEEGFCGCCVAKLLEGEVEMAADDALSKDEKKRGLILTCQSTPKTKRCAFEYLDP